MPSSSRSSHAGARSICRRSCSASDSGAIVARPRAGTEFSFFIFRLGPGTQQLCGGVTLSNIRRRAAMHANLGYWMSVDAAGKGIMSEAVNMILPFVFSTLELRRLQAACLPHNAASRRVLEKNGFREEGFAESYLQIDGDWRDHVLYGLTRDRFLKART